MIWKIFKKKIENPFLPNLARIKDIKQETNTVKTFKLKFLDKSFQKSFTFMPGQFIQVSVFGIGEAPISVCSSPFNKKYFEISVRNVGNVTNSLCKSKRGDIIGIRGPYGNGYPMNKLLYSNIVMVAGGIGFPPIKSVIEYIHCNRNDFGKLWLLYGARDPNDIVFKEELEKWKNEEDFEILLTVDNPTPEWKGHVGVVTTLFDEIKITNKNTVGFVCGPPVMMKFVTQKFQQLGFGDDQIYLSMERLMKCGFGKCGHCNIGKKYVCIDGPVFRYDELKGLTEKIW
jgi:sulfite reductase subunit B